jgi:hypothetical protein
MRPLNGSLLKPACPLRVNLATVRAQRRFRAVLGVVRRHLALVVITIVTMAGWSSPNRNVVPRFE